jgi:DNA adenine methylase
MSRKDDFVFLDPPYTVRHNNNGFIKYNENLFSWEDQVRLSRAVARAERRGVKLLVSNADHPSVRQLYENIGETITLDRYSVIGGGAGYRSNTTEIVVKVGY